MDTNHLVRVAFREGREVFYAEADAGVVVADGPRRGHIDLRIGDGRVDTFSCYGTEWPKVGRPVVNCAPRTATMNLRLALTGAFWRIVPAQQVTA